MEKAGRNNECSSVCGEEEMNSPEIVVELWHILVGGAAGIGAISFAWMRIQAILAGFRNATVEEALRREKVEMRLGRLEEKVGSVETSHNHIVDRLDDIQTLIYAMREESTKQHSELKTYLISEIRDLEEKIYGCRTKV